MSLMLGSHFVNESSCWIPNLFVLFLWAEPGLKKVLPSSHKVLIEVQWQPFFSLLRPISKYISSAVCLCSPCWLCNILWYIQYSVCIPPLNVQSWIQNLSGISDVAFYLSRCTLNPYRPMLNNMDSLSGPAAYICTLETEQQTSRPGATSIQWHQRMRKYCPIVHIVWILSNIHTMWLSVSQTHTVCVCVRRFVVFVWIFGVWV